MRLSLRTWLCMIMTVSGGGCFVDRSGIDISSQGSPRAGCADGCENGGVCVGNQCFCGPVDYDGPSCAETIDDCMGVDCGKGTCVDLVRDYACNCDERWTIDAAGRCTVELLSCETPNACIQGICDDSTGQVTCACLPGFQGTNCNAPVNCQAPPEPPPNAVGTGLTGTEFGDTATFDCALGFVEASTTVSCQADATWETPQLFCVDEPGCGAPAPLEFGGASTPNGTGVGAVAYYSCDPGFFLISYLTNTVVCQETEEWSPIFGACLPIGTCADDPCVYGECTDFPGAVPTFQCTCDPGWTGPRCDM